MPYHYDSVSWLLTENWIFSQSHFLEAVLIKMDNNYFYRNTFKTLECNITSYIL